MIEKMSREELERSFRALQQAYADLRYEYNLLRQKTGKSEYMVW